MCSPSSSKSLRGRATVSARPGRTARSTRWGASLSCRRMAQASAPRFTCLGPHPRHWSFFRQDSDGKITEIDRNPVAGHGPGNNKGPVRHFCRTGPLHVRFGLSTAWVLQQIRDPLSRLGNCQSSSEAFQAKVLSFPAVRQIAGQLTNLYPLERLLSGLQNGDYGGRQRPPARRWCSHATLA